MTPRPQNLMNFHKRRNCPRPLGALALVLLLAGLVQSSRAQEMQPAAFLPLVMRRDLVMTTRTPTATPTATNTPTRTATPRPTATRTATPRPAPTATLTSQPVRLTIAITQPGTNDEYFTVTNAGATDQPMTGWTVQSYDGTTSPCTIEPTQLFRFPGDFVLRAGRSVRVHSGPTGGDRPRTEDDLPWRSQLTWNNDGDRGDLRNPNGQVVSSAAYGGCR